MNKILSEINEKPQRAFEVLSGPEFSLPLEVPYIGMGSSYFAPLCFKYMRIAIQPEIASEYFTYLSNNKVQELAVILSQSGKSSEALWCTGLFKNYIAITNNTGSPLAKNLNVQKVVSLLAGEEKYSSSKTYINTLLTLFKGFGENITPYVHLLEKRFSLYQDQGKAMAGAVYQALKQRLIHGIYITGSGPNIGTALEAALILSESTKLSFQGLPLAQYDHGPKETAANSIVMMITSKGDTQERTVSVKKRIEAAGAQVFTVEEPQADENHSVLYNIVPFNFMAYHLAVLLKVEDTFVVGGKVTEVQ
ncbi:MAG: hypothetical protein WKF89_02480 [Chitinophagaceae bacterium]